MRPYLRVKNVFEDRIDLADVKEMDFSPEEYEKYKLESGDILLNEGQSPELVGRPAMYRGELPGVCFTNSLIRFRPHPGIDGLYALYAFRHMLHRGRFMREARITTNIAHLSAGRFAAVEFPVPPSQEQRRIVASLEELFSHLDAAEALLRSARSRLERFLVICRAMTFGQRWPTKPLNAVADVQLGKMLSAKSRTGVGSTPYLRNRNVRWGSVDLTDVAVMDFSDAERAKFGLVPGEEDLRVLDVPLPPVTVQSQLVEEVGRQESLAHDLNTGLEITSKRARALLRSTLVAAFSGRLVDQTSEEEPASVLLDRIRAGRESIPARPRRKR
jgi:type I restriction enzyme S subunit